MSVATAPLSPSAKRPAERRADVEPVSETPARSSKGVFAFRAELDLAELDQRGRPGPTWTGRAVDLSRGQVTIRSRRMCYEGREVVLAVHLVDDHPVPLFGIVARSDYDGDGLYKTTLNLAALPESDSIRNWMTIQSQRT